MAEGQASVPLRAAELTMLLDGIDWQKVQRRRRYHLLVPDLAHPAVQEGLACLPGPRPAPPLPGGAAAISSQATVDSIILAPA